MGPRSLAAQIIAQNVSWVHPINHCLQSCDHNECTDGCQEPRIRLTGNRNLSGSLGHLWLGLHPGMGWVKLDGDWSWCQCQGMQSRTLGHRPVSSQSEAGIVASWPMRGRDSSRLRCAECYLPGREWVSVHSLAPSLGSHLLSLNHLGFQTKNWPKSSWLHRGDLGRRNISS